MFLNYLLKLMSNRNHTKIIQTEHYKANLSFIELYWSFHQTRQTYQC